ncbi:type III polyketide synthase [Peribacillus kribbensis]|uniref:type III polyketide synthase n=1 Tax=Peribacillus kribbensis TaxID=356658 RepID=UPI000478C9FC|nr:3-oxoacyl-[acyl-carrier-protein] synthase III C-terminal domain-containing protein [Peribacillus kribbensis]
MAHILSISEVPLPYRLNQKDTMEFAREMFGSSFRDIDRLLKVFINGEIETRSFASDLEWFKETHTFEEKNTKYIETAVEFGAEAIKTCLNDASFLKNKVHEEEIDAIFFISSTGISTPSIEARIMNLLPFSPHTKRIPIWGLGCAGGAAGLSRAFDYCKAYPEANVLVLSVELCSLTFQKDDRSKSNLIGTSIFADGISCALLCGEKSSMRNRSALDLVPLIEAAQSTLLHDSQDVMGWDIKNEGLYVIFSKDIPTLISNWLKPNVEEFLTDRGTSLNEINHFIAHPGGKKVIQAYEESLGFTEQKTKISLDVLKEHGNMSSATILYVLRRFMEGDMEKGDLGLAAALGPGFSSELLLMRWT